MMRLPSFIHLAPRTAAEAARMLAGPGPEVAVVAGGTGLYPAMKRRQAEPRALVSLGAVDELRGIRVLPDGGVSVGAMTRLSDLARSDAVPAALSGAASVVASPQIRAMETVAGNLCLDTRCTYYDMPQDWRDAVGSCLKAGGDTCRIAPPGPAGRRRQLPGRPDRAGCRGLGPAALHGGGAAAGGAEAHAGAARRSW